MVWVSVRAAGKFWEEWNGEKKEWGMRSGQDNLGKRPSEIVGKDLVQWDTHLGIGCAWNECQYLQIDRHR
jgi:hypothetical protein